MNTRTLATMLLPAALLACGAPDTAGPTGSNPFLEDLSDSGKEDSAYLNPDGIEVEVDLEGDVEGSSWQLMDGPASVGQYALTYLRKGGTVFLESLAEDATADNRVEWQINGAWVTADKVHTIPNAKLRHWRLRSMNAVLLFSAAKGVTVGKVLTAKVPLKPFSTMADLGNTCADGDNHITLGQDVYWYRWEPNQTRCKAVTQDLKITVSKLLPTRRTVYPEYDRLIADKKITSVILFGQIGDGPITESETGVVNMARFARWLTDASFKEVKPAPVGRRFSKLINNITVEIDLYSPRDFSGLGDYAHFDNFQKALSEHEIVAYDGHSMLGASDFWSRPKYPAFYQVFLYGGCLGYEYYVRPIVNGKGGWQNVDILSSVIEVTADANDFAGPFMARLIYTIQHGYKVSWRSHLTAIRNRVGDSTFGVSGVRDNCYSPSGSYCK